MKKITAKRLHEMAWDETTKWTYAIRKLAGMLSSFVDCLQFNERLQTVDGLKYDTNFTGDQNIFMAVAILRPDLVTKMHTHDLSYATIKNIDKLVKEMYDGGLEIN